jgi:preprotein translocase subunit SecG
MKKITKLLVGGFVAISIAVAFIPSVFGIVLTDVTNPAQLALLTIARWLIPLGIGFVIVMMGLRAFSKGRKTRRSRR